jgi:hypothetical protein
LPGSTVNPTVRRLSKALVPQNLTEDLVADSRPITFWRLDKTRLVAAVNRFAPHVPVVDQS